MHVAAKCGNLAVVKLLRRDWPFLTAAKDDIGLLPIHMAAAGGCLNVVEFLCKELPETVHDRSMTQVTPMHVAGARGSVSAEVLPILVPTAAV